MDIKITHIDTACLLLEINGYKILTDPTLDNAGKLYHHGFGAFSRKTENPTLQISDLKDVDLILLSHHQHKDNFDTKGKELASKVPLIISTKNASKKLKNTIGLDNWESHDIETAKIKGLKITATPAQHRPSWIPEFISGKVIGFIIEFDGQEKGVIYISGDTVYFKEIDEIARRYKINLGIFHVGSVQFRYLSGFGKYTMDSNDLLKSATLLNPKIIIPIHQKGWTHFKETEAHLKEFITKNEFLRPKTLCLKSGKTYQF